MDEPEWYRQPGLSCEFCGRPGHLIAIAPPISVVVAETFDPSADFTIQVRVTCPEHRFLVRNRADRLLDERRFAEHVHGRPVLDAETYPEQIKRSVGTIIRRLHGWDGAEDGR